MEAVTVEKRQSKADGGETEEEVTILPTKKDAEGGGEGEETCLDRILDAPPVSRKTCYIISGILAGLILLLALILGLTLGLKTDPEPVKTEPKKPELLPSNLKCEAVLGKTRAGDELVSLKRDSTAACCQSCTDRVFPKYCYYWDYNSETQMCQLYGKWVTDWKSKTEESKVIVSGRRPSFNFTFDQSPEWFQGGVVDLGNLDTNRRFQIFITTNSAKANYKTAWDTCLRDNGRLARINGNDVYTNIKNKHEEIDEKIVATIEKTGCESKADYHWLGGKVVGSREEDWIWVNGEEAEDGVQMGRSWPEFWSNVQNKAEELFDSANTAVAFQADGGMDSGYMSFLAFSPAQQLCRFICEYPD